MPEETRKTYAFVPSHGNPFTKALMDAGIVPPNCRRYVIDSGNPDSVMTIHFDCYGDERLLEVIRAVPELKILTKAAEPAPASLASHEGPVEVTAVASEERSL